MGYRDIKIDSNHGTERLGKRGSHNQQSRSKQGSNAFAHDSKLDTNNLNGSGTNLTEDGTLDTKKNRPTKK